MAAKRKRTGWWPNDWARVRTARDTYHAILLEDFLRPDKDGWFPLDYVATTKPPEIWFGQWSPPERTEKVVPLPRYDLFYGSEIRVLAIESPDDLERATRRVRPPDDFLEWRFGLDIPLSRALLAEAPSVPALGSTSSLTTWITHPLVFQPILRGGSHPVKLPQEHRLRTVYHWHCADCRVKWLSDIMASLEHDFTRSSSQLLKELDRLTISFPDHPVRKQWRKLNAWWTMPCSLCPEERQNKPWTVHDRKSGKTINAHKVCRDAQTRRQRSSAKVQVVDGAIARITSMLLRLGVEGTSPLPSPLETIEVGNHDSTDARK